MTTPLSAALPRLGVIAAIVAAAIVAGMAAGMAMSRNDTGDGGDTADAGQPVAAQCSSDIGTLQIAADPGVATMIQGLADRYTADLLDHDRECIPIVVTPTSSSAVVGRLTNGWKEQTHGPTPDVWIPQSTLWVDLLRAQLKDPQTDDESAATDDRNPSMVDEDPSILARTPTVLAMPRPMAEALGWPQEQVTWGDVFALADSIEGWAAREHAEWGAFRLRLTDPRYNITGLQALLALDDAQRAQTSNNDDDTALSLFRVQRVLSDIDTDAAEELDVYASSDDFAQTLSAVPLEERQVWRFNQTGAADEQATEAASAQAGDKPELVAVYPQSDGEMAVESDYPYLVLDAPWVEERVLQYADEFGDYLLSDAGIEQFTAAGFRTPANEPGEQLRSSDSVAPSEVALPETSESASSGLPDVGAVQELRSTWVTVPRLSTTLYLVDVSGSMKAQVPGTDETRLEATIDAAKRSLQIVPAGTDVGLWEFSTDLPDGENGGDYRRLVDIGPLDELVDGEQTRRAEIVGELDDLAPRDDTALNDTVLAAYEAMRADYTPGQRHTIVLLTDGRNDDEDSISHDQLIDGLLRLRKPEQPIQVVSIAYGDQPDIDKLTEISETVGGKVLEAPDLDNLDQLFIEALAQ